MIDPHSTKIQTIDETKQIIIPGDHDQTITYCVNHFIKLAQKAITNRGFFSVALSGGSTPKAIFQKLCSTPYKTQIDWSKILLFWSDERSIAPSHPDSNFHMAMTAGFQSLPIPKEHIFRMKAEEDIKKNAAEYQSIIEDKLGGEKFDLVMLGMGDDGHTASLFPNTKALQIEDLLVYANFLPQKDTWRMTLTYPCINNSQNIAVYILGDKKTDILQKILKANHSPTYPVEKIGSKKTKALWIADLDAAKKLKD